MKKNLFLNYFLVIVIITVVFGTIYITVQQSYRTGANDPQIQIARDISTKLQYGKTIEAFFTDTIDISKSLTTVVALYDINGKPIRSSGYLNGSLPELPLGVFDYVKTHDEYEVTWQPRSDVRMAMVIVNTNSSPVGFVVAGRSLKEVEMREHNLVTIIFIGWIISIAFVLVHALLQFFKERENKI
ncbi:MAG: hypothetical protein ACRDE8_00345 [Ginsengibacter sp.]